MEILIQGPTPGSINRQAKLIERVQIASMHKSVDRATSLAQRGGQQKARAVGLGRLAGAIAYTSSEKKKQRDPNNAWGSVYVKGGDDSRAGQALESYTQGATIKGRNVQWLAIATNAIPKRVGRFRMTPARYEAAGSPLGPLVFHQISANRAVLVIQGDLKVSRKTGKASIFTGRVTRASTRSSSVVAFVLIKETRRMQRFDQKAITQRASTFVPQFIREEMDNALPDTFERG